jgi:nitrate/TMAO reductase-like tetraheme cytochrome c subunit
MEIRALVFQDRMRLSAWLVRLAALALSLGIAGAAGGGASGDRAFLEQHWRRPIPPQGMPPARFSTLEKSLAPSSCGTCHPAQLADWRTSRHARSMAPGVSGQLVGMWSRDPESAQICASCHAPLAEQQPKIAVHGRLGPNPDFDAGLQRAGVTCAACRVRHHERFGPPRRDRSLASSTSRGNLPHNGVTRTAAFTRSEFCASCHQFTADDLALNGKLLENTYEEWKRSPAARSGRQCQDCHMPDRRHLWRGIHDPAMVKSGVEITVTTEQPRYRPGEEVAALIAVNNVGVGHDFPTYVTPRVVVRASLVDRQGTAVPDSAREYVIGREVALDLSREISDTRIPPGERASFRYRQRLPGPGLALRVTVTVYPDHFYTAFFKSLLASGNTDTGAPDIRQALEATQRSAFAIFNQDVPLTR